MTLLVGCMSMKMTTASSLRTAVSTAYSSGLEFHVFGTHDDDDADVESDPLAGQCGQRQQEDKAERFRTSGGSS